MWVRYSEDIVANLINAEYKTESTCSGEYIVFGDDKTFTICDTISGYEIPIVSGNDLKYCLFSINSNNQYFVSTLLHCNGYKTSVKYDEHHHSIQTDSCNFIYSSDTYSDLTTNNLIPVDLRAIDYTKLRQFMSDGNSWDIPLDNKSVFQFDEYDKDTMNLFLDYGVVTKNERDLHNPYRSSKYVTEKTSNKYHAYIYDNGIKGAKLYNGEYTWATLRLFPFLMHRINDKKKVDELMEKIDKLTYTWDENQFTVNDSLIGGYNNTQIDSCMQGYGNFFENFEDAGVLLEYKTPNFIGRAIIWSDQYISGLPEGCNGIMDRVYPSGNHKVVEAYKKYAIKHNLMFKQYQNYEYKQEFVWKNENVSMHLELTPPNAGKSNYHPYMDTFSYTDDFNSFNNRGGDIQLDSTGGGNSQSSICSCCGCLVDEDDVCHADDDAYCRDCFSEDYFFCDNCGDWEHNDYCRETDAGDSICRNCSERYDYVYCDDIEVYSRDYVTTEDTGSNFNMTKNLYYTEDTENYYEHSTKLYYDEESSTYWTSEQAFLEKD